MDIGAGKLDAWIEAEIDRLRAQHSQAVREREAALDAHMKTIRRESDALLEVTQHRYLDALFEWQASVGFTHEKQRELRKQEDSQRRAIDAALSAIERNVTQSYKEFREWSNEREDELNKNVTKLQKLGKALVDIVRERINVKHARLCPLSIFLIGFSPLKDLPDLLVRATI